MRRGTTTSTPLGSTTIRARRARSERLIVYSNSAIGPMSLGRRAVGNGLVIHACDLLDQRGPRVAPARHVVRGLTPAPSLGLVVHGLHERVRHRLLVVRRHKPARLALVHD